MDGSLRVGSMVVRYDVGWRDGERRVVWILAVGLVGCKFEGGKYGV